MLCRAHAGGAMQPRMTVTPIVGYGRWLSGVPADWPSAARDAAHQAFIDMIGVTVRGAAEEAPRRVLEAVGRWSDGRSTVIGTKARLSPPLAALVNGTAAHALDFDDQFDPAKAHATAVLAPAILALTEPRASSGSDCLDAYISGLQILGRVGEALNPVHRHRGWHATATLGAIGAAAACARLLRLDAQQSAYALSIATSMAGGFMSQFGTMAKAMHAGLAAQAGVTAASFARSGVDAGLATFDGPTGMTALMMGPDPECLSEQRFDAQDVGEPLLIVDPGLKVKRFPNCASAHRAMDGILYLKHCHGFSAGDVETVLVRAPQAHLNNLMYVDPANAMQAKFSLEFALALLLVEDACRISHFTDETICREDLRRLYARVRRAPLDDAEGGVRTEVEVVLKDGRALATAVSHAVGSSAKPFSREDVWTKFDGCVSEVLSSDQAARLSRMLQRLPELGSIVPLMRELQAG